MYIIASVTLLLQNQFCRRSIMLSNLQLISKISPAPDPQLCPVPLKYRWWQRWCQFKKWINVTVSPSLSPCDILALNMINLWWHQGVTINVVSPSLSPIHYLCTKSASGRTLGVTIFEDYLPGTWKASIVANIASREPAKMTYVLGPYCMMV